MKNLLLLISISISTAIHAQIISDFTLPNVSDGSIISLSGFRDAKGIVVIFTSNNCPYAKLYEDRILNLYKLYSESGLKVILINSNSPLISPEDKILEMKSKAVAKKFPFPYLAGVQK